MEGEWITHPDRPIFLLNKNRYDSFLRLYIQAAHSGVTADRAVYI